MAHHLPNLDDESMVSNSDLYWSRFRDAEECFVAALKEPVRLVDMPANEVPTGPGTQKPQTQPQKLQTREFRDLKTLTDYLEDSANEDYACRVISICQRNSWAPLQITKPMLQKLIYHHRIDPSFLEVPFSFHYRDSEQEQAFSVPWTSTQSEDDNSYDIAYTFRHSSPKPTASPSHNNEPYVIRHTGVYQKLNLDSDSTKRKSVMILFSPTPNSAAEQRVFSSLQRYDEKIRKNPLWLHSVIHATYFSLWRDYLKAYEKMLLPIGNATTATYIDEPLRIHHGSLVKVRFLESRFLPANAILANFSEVLFSLQSFVEQLHSVGHISSSETLSTIRRLQNTHKQCQTYNRTAKFLQLRSNSTAQLLSDTLAFKNQIVAQEQNISMLKLTKSAVFLTILTFLYLPWTFVGTLFGMNFFDLDDKTHRIVASPMIWIYIVASAALTGITMLLYYWVARRDGEQSRLAPKGSLKEPTPEQRNSIHLSQLRTQLPHHQRQTTFLSV